MYVYVVCENSVRRLQLQERVRLLQDSRLSDGSIARAEDEARMQAEAAARARAALIERVRLFSVQWRVCVCVSVCLFVRLYVCCFPP